MICNYFHVYDIHGTTKTMFPPSYYHNGFVAAFSLGHIMYGYTNVYVYIIRFFESEEILLSKLYLNKKRLKKYRLRFLIKSPVCFFVLFCFRKGWSIFSGFLGIAIINLT